MQHFTIPSEWLNWLKENLERGCDITSLVTIMANNGYSQPLTREAIKQIQTTLNMGSQLNLAAPLNLGAQAYRYESPRVPVHVNSIVTTDRRVLIGMRLHQPVIMTFDNLLSAAECDELINRAAGKMKKSMVVDETTGINAYHQDRRSEGAFFKFKEDEFIARLERRIAEVMHWPAENGEGIQILHYLPGGEYKAHYDYFPYQVAGSKKHLATGGQRVSTLIIYLNDVEQGGETSFPEVGVAIVPKKGSAVYFEYCNSHGQVDKLTLHAGNPVVKGEKWICTKWMRQHKYN